MTALPPTTDDRPIWDLWNNAVRLPVATAAADLGILEVLSDEALTTAELAAKLSLDARMLAVFLAGLCSIGLIDKGDGRWSATHVARSYLHPQARANWSPFLKMFPAVSPLHGEFIKALKSGQRPRDSEDQKPEWEKDSMTPEAAAGVAAFMNAHSEAPARGCAMQSEFAEIGSVLDVGCGSGIYGIMMAEMNRQLQVGLMDLPAMCVEIEKYVARSQAAERIAIHQVDMFNQTWPADYEAHFYANVMHDWSTETNTLLARKSFEALPSGGRIFLSEILMNDDGTGPWEAASFGLMMMMGTFGKQYSLPEFRAILEDAGFTGVRARRHGGGYYSLVSATRP